jgi:hypothetical protein
LPDSAVGLPQGPAVTFMPRRLRAFWPRNTWAGAPTLQHPPFPKPWCEPPNRAPGVPAARTDGSILRHQCRPLSPSGCLRTRLRIPPSLSWRNIGACRAPGPRNSLSRGSRCIVSLAASPSRRSACETPSDRSLRGESRHSDGTATTLRSSRADFAGFRGCHAFGTSMRRWGCAGRSYPSTSSSRSPRTWWERGVWREQDARIQPQAGMGRILVCVSMRRK